MGANHFGYVLSIFLLLSGLLLPSSNTDTFEIKFEPAGVVYRQTLGEDSELFDCMLHDLVIINRSNVGVALQKVEIHLLSKGEVVQSR